MANEGRWEVDRVAQIVDSAAHKLMQLWPGQKGRSGQNALKISLKADGSFVTDADYAASDILVKGLKSLFPADAILSEETQFEERMLEHGRFWLIDPLDGTASFLDGADDFSILVTCLEDGYPRFAYVFFPAIPATFQAAAGAGAQGNRKSLHVSNSQSFDPAKVLCRNFQPRSKAAFGRTEIDSGLMFMKVCKGEIDGAVLKIKRHREWDLAPLVVLVEESGGKITDEHGEPLTFFQAALSGKYVVASNGHIHDELLAAIL